MEQSLTFRYSLPAMPEGELIELSAVEVEQHLLRRLKDEAANPDQALWELAGFYSRLGKPESALNYFRRVLARKTEPEEKARCILAMGATMETARDYESAVRFYREAFSMEPMNTDTWYWINNNLGFSLNVLGQYELGEKYCRQATLIDPGRSNGYKNLGISFEGRGHYADAAKCYVQATQVNAADDRSLKLLEDLVSKRPELAYELETELQLCRKAVQVAGEAVAARMPVVHRGWRKRLVLCKAGLKRAWKSLHAGKIHGHRSA